MGELREDAEIETLLAQEDERLARVDELRDELRSASNYLRDRIIKAAGGHAPAPTVEELLPLLAALSDALTEGAI